VDELNRAVSQIDTTTQQNAATVEELASTSDNLSNEANDLANTVARFKVSKDEQTSKVKRSVLKKQQPVKAKAERIKVAAADFEDDFEEF
jgi:methyl-accepting chemotaxis protein